MCPYEILAQMVRDDAAGRFGIDAMQALTARLPAFSLLNSIGSRVRQAEVLYRLPRRTSQSLSTDAARH